MWELVSSFTICFPHPSCILTTGVGTKPPSAAQVREDSAIRGLARQGGLLSLGDILAANDVSLTDENVKVKETETHRSEGLKGLVEDPGEHIEFYEGLCLGRTISAAMQAMLEMELVS